ncbi:MAG: TIGR04283 family arsenosugar biosynthesis glycosyltransferase [Nostoc sp. DedVER02]|uniref:TIGR04283 family arsenosugar biosynthesis glycosyltransferase n=1 Tax=unclassified Nostoc TaxID=2593658 RepID=UPI002AD4FCC8|nr:MULTISPECIES: TIGR04283 family arsenosugar biosynthesis glycosyltransferase [unclassified Nostoc]MDZ7987736.1 TIGR04283 family arsenosugar biosynthesis glycosyltransferase [Nostoc sp. DedVER02]MDZ8116143.1 TIGR04283 family arsenosugar biosynthesis glycosyltransferase [Nostoc sp. DedVER01b]
MSQVSIIIPTLNEAANLERTLHQLTLLNPPAFEVIVVDGGSEDETVKVAKQIFESFNRTLNLQVISSQQPGRSIQMNYGALTATGDFLCFLHADTWVPDDLITVIIKTLAEPNVACGGFISLMSGSQTTRWGISLHNYLKTYYAPLLFKPHLFFRGLRLLFGDQVMFCRRIDFWDCGGFDRALPIMEDGDLCLKLVKKGRIYLVNRIVQSSDRRVAKWGSWKATAIYLYIGILWGIGIDANYLKRFYQDIR